MRQLLQAGVDRADHGVVAIGISTAEIKPKACAFELPQHVITEEGIAAEGGFAAGGGIDVEWAALRIDQGLIAEPTLLMHQLEHKIAPFQAGAGILWIAGAVAIGTGQQAHEKRRLTHIEIAGRLAEIQLCGLLKAFGAQAEVSAIEVKLEDPVFAETHLQLQRDPELAQLAGEAQITAHLRIHHPGHLLGEATAAARTQQS